MQTFCPALCVFVKLEGNAMFKTNNDTSLSIRYPVQVDGGRRRSGKGRKVLKIAASVGAGMGAVALAFVMTWMLSV